jgi:hypothetical protein
MVLVTERYFTVCGQWLIQSIHQKNLICFLETHAERISLAEAFKAKSEVGIDVVLPL